MGDNLGVNQTLGFSAGFLNSRCCRLCTISPREFGTVFCENDCPLRTISNYAEAVSNLPDSTKTYGIKEECVLHAYSSYHCILNIYGDGMHDLPGGVCQCNLSLILHEFIHVKQYLTLEHLNTKIHGFSYDEYDENRIPEIPASAIGGTGSFKIIMTSAEMLTLMKYFGLLVGDKIPKNDKHRRLYILLNKILTIVRSKFYQKTFHIYFGSLIEEYLYLRSELFPGTANLNITCSCIIPVSCWKLDPYGMLVA